MTMIIHETVHHVTRHLKDSFIPHEGNNHRPHAVSHRMLVVYSVLLVVVKAAALVATVALPSASLYSSSITPGNIVELTNATRRNLNLEKLATNPLLNQAAQAKADDMMAAQYFSHNSPSGLTPWDWFKRANYRYVYAGENLAVHYSQAEDVEEGWMASPSHRANIVNPHYTEIGVGVSLGTFEGVQSSIVVQLFGQPAPALASDSAPAPVRTPVTRVVAPEPPAPVELPSGQVAAASSAPAPKLAAAAPTPPAPEPVPAPSVIEESLQLKQLPRAYQVSVAINDAASVMAQLAGQTVPLQRVGDTNVWAGDVPYDASTMGASGEQLSIVAVGADGTSVNQALAMVAPYAQAPQVFNFQGTGSRQVKILGVNIGGLNDSVKQFYLYFAIFLVVATLLNVLIKIRIQHPTIIGHAAGVLALAVILFLV